MNKMIKSIKLAFKTKNIFCRVLIIFWLLTCALMTFAFFKDQTPKIDKYDPMVPENLLRSAYLHNQMKVLDAINIINNLEIGS